ncbi:hypothetical protein M441DRAFT_123703, partial [Trichoderma asperellum CBS 433.97]
LTHTMTRMQAIAVVEPLVYRIQRELWQNALNDELVSKWKEETVAVLPLSSKAWLATWARQAGKPIILERLEKFAEDREVYQWTETQRRPGLALWSTTSPAVTILDDLFELAEVPDLNREMARRKLKAMTASLRHYIFKMEERMYLRAKAEAMKGINGLQDTIKLAMANSTDGIQDTIKLSIKEEMQSFQQGNEKGTTK